jgi:hypothetical protein
MSRTFDRRTVLRGMLSGLVVGAALPMLDGMLNTNGTALADGTPLPKRFGWWFFGNGIHRSEWIPATPGEGFEETRQMKPLHAAGLRPYMSVISGTRVDHDGTPWVAHHSGRCGITSGSFKMVGDYPYDNGPSIGQVVDTALKGKSPFGQVPVGISQRGFDTSHQVNGEVSPQKLWDTLFGMGKVEDPNAPKIIAARKSVLDVVYQDAKSLENKLGSADKAKLAAHLDTLRGIETRLAAMPSSCSLPTRPGPLETINYSKELLSKNAKLMSDILAVAFACDLTRSFRFFMTGMQTDTVFWEVGADRGLHTISHETSTTSLEQHKNAVVFMMEQLAYLASKLKAMPEGSGNVLDNSVIMACSEQGQDHDINNMPIVLLGRGGGKLKGNYHYKSTTKELCTKAHMTCLHALDIPATEFGQGSCRSTESIGALMT